MGVNGIVAFIGESRGEGDGLDTLKGALHSSLDRSSIKLCCCLWVKNQDLFVTLVNVTLHGKTDTNAFPLNGHEKRL